MGKKFRLGEARATMQSYSKGICTHFGKKRCIVHNKKLKEEQKVLPPEERCKGKDHKCEYFCGTSPHVPPYDKNYVLPPIESETLAFALEEGDNILLHGPPGGGKTSLVKQLASILNWGIIQYSCSEEMTSAKILGQWIISGKKMLWADGYITTAMRNGFILLEDEADFMRPELRGEVHGIMEKDGSITQSNIHPTTGEPFQEIVPKHPSFRWISTANTIGYGDDLFAFHGTQMMNSAARDRYEIIQYIGYKTPEQEKEILMLKTDIEQDIADLMIKIANE